MSIVIKKIGVTDYQETFEKMKSFTNSRDDNSKDEIWLTEHYPVFTQGQAGKPEHILQQSNIPIIKSDRGGQVTYHAPGQIIIYILIDIKRANIGVRQIITILENSVVAYLSSIQIKSSVNPKAPGVYVGNEKISSVGLRIRKGRTYHGVSINVDMDLSPFKFINPCGYEGLEVVNINSITSNTNISPVAVGNGVVKEILKNIISIK